MTSDESLRLREASDVRTHHDGLHRSSADDRGEGYPVRRSESVTIEIPVDDVVTPEQMKIALKDAELMLELLRDRPDEMRSLYNDVVAGRTDAVKETATRIGLSESSFRERGGRCGATRDEIVSFDLTGLRTTVPR